jgi:hypothetical protein
MLSLVHLFILLSLPPLYLFILLCFPLTSYPALLSLVHLFVLLYLSSSLLVYLTLFPPCVLILLYFPLVHLFILLSLSPRPPPCLSYFVSTLPSNPVLFSPFPAIYLTFCFTLLACPALFSPLSAYSSYFLFLSIVLVCLTSFPIPLCFSLIHLFILLSLSSSLLAFQSCFVFSFSSYTVFLTFCFSLLACSALFSPCSAVYVIGLLKPFVSFVICFLKAECLPYEERIRGRGGWINIFSPLLSAYHFICMADRSPGRGSCCPPRPAQSHSTVHSLRAGHLRPSSLGNVSHCHMDYKYDLEGKMDWQ